jgi:hypothetical protein
LGNNAPDALHERVMGAIAKSLTHAVSEVIACAAEGVAQFLRNSRRDFMLRCVGALARKARLVSELIVSEKHLRYADRRQPADLERSVLPEIRALIAGGGVNVEAEVTRLDLSEWPGQEAASAILTLLSYCPDEVVAQDAYRRLARFLVECWETARDRTNRRERNYEFEYQCLERLARFVMQFPVETALTICEPLLNAVDEHPREVARFVEDLIVIENQAGGKSPFWDIWQAFADSVQIAGWIHQLDSRYTIGKKSLPNGFVVISSRLQAGNASQMLSQGNTVFYLESLLRRFCYSEPVRIKSNPEIRSDVLMILDQLVDSGSSAAYRMRDDFVTPIAHQHA